MPGFTKPDGFIHEVRGDQPGISLRAPDEILAEQVQAKVSTMDATISALQSRVSALENGTGGVGWIPIGTGDESGDNFSIDLSAGGKFPSPPRWNMIRVHMRTDLSLAGRDISMRINADSSTDYRSAIAGINATESFTGEGSHLTDADRWVVGRGSTISTGNLELLLFHTAANPGLINFQSTATRQSGSDSAHVYFMAWGSKQAGGAQTPESLLFFVGSNATGGENFVDADWWAEGLRMEHPT